MSIYFANLKNSLKTKKAEIVSGVILILLFLLFLSIMRCSHNANKAQELRGIVKYHADTISWYVDRLGRETAQKQLLSASAKELKKANKKLYEELKREKKTKFVSTSSIEYRIDTLYRDTGRTTFTVVSDSVLSDVKIDLGTIIVGYDKKRRLFAKSTNPNVHIDSLDGVLLTEKPRRLGVGVFFGPSLNYGVIGRDIDVGFSIGVGLTWRIKK